MSTPTANNRTAYQQPLIRLSTGTWIRPEVITSIQPLQRCSETIPDRVVILSLQTTDIIPCDDFAAAQALADQLSARVNTPA